MTEWGVVIVIVTLFGLIAAIVKPIVNMTRAMTRLTVVMEQTEKSLNKLTTDNTESHRRIWNHNEEQDATINDHEVRIGILDHKDK